MLIKYCPDHVIFDIETTGLSPESDAIIEIAALKVSDGEVADTFSTLVDPKMHIPYYASSINGITDDMVSGSPSIDIALNEFVDFVGEDILVGHNIRGFDLKFINRDMVNIRGSELPNEYVDTLVVARRYLPDIGSHSLESLAALYKVSYEGAHRALADCYINEQVYAKLKEEILSPSASAKLVKTCPKCGNLLKRRTGKFGEFYGCRSYPDCKYTENIRKDIT